MAIDFHKALEKSKTDFTGKSIEFFTGPYKGGTATVIAQDKDGIEFRFFNGNKSKVQRFHSFKVIDFDNSAVWQKIQKAPDPLYAWREDGKMKACIYPEPFQGKTKVVCYLYCRNTKCCVFFACSKEVADKLVKGEWSDGFIDYAEGGGLFSYCQQHTDWNVCNRYGIDYNEQTSDGDDGCDGTICDCEPFGSGDYVRGIAEIDDFRYYTK